MPDSIPDAALDNYSPDDQATGTVSSAEAQLAAALALAAKLQEQVDRETAAKAMSTPAVRLLAIQLHGKLCPADHLALRCTWYGEDPELYDHPEAANWTTDAHARWLGIASYGCYLQRTAGWTVVEPAPPAEPPQEEPPQEEPPQE
jgi:hypothetical protein